jgi:aryl-alcohol dehydrogenase-like predicted oxidoreductase
VSKIECRRPRPVWPAGCPQLCLGAMMFGDQTDEAASRAIIASAREAVSELYRHRRRLRRRQIPNRSVRAVPSELSVTAASVATKVGFLPDPHAAGRSQSLTQELDASGRQ